MKKHILFVDDNPNILTSLRRMLRPIKNEWNMEFVGSGKEALEVLSKTLFNVVISDIRMPEMDGIELLTIIKKQYPNIIRIALSGETDQEVTLRSIGPTHQFLAKPCSAEQIIEVVKRSCSLQDSLSDETLTSLVTGLDSLPSLPSVYLEIVEELESPQSSLTRVGEIISKDLGMTAKIMQLVNSAFFGLPQRISTPTQAVTLLGVDTIKALALSIKIFEEYDSPATNQLDVQGLWAHSNRVSVLAKKIASSENLEKSEIDDAFMAGILHDVGILILASNLPELYSEVLQSSTILEHSLVEAEQNLFQKTHAEVGGYLMGLWGLSTSIIEAIVYHHKPSDSPNSKLSCLTAVHVANALDQIQQSNDEVSDELILDNNYLNDLGIIDKITAWRLDYETSSGSENDHG